MKDNADLNYAWAWAICEGLRAGGVLQVIISPGSRSTPLALAAFRHPELQTRVILDERTAAFFALGAAKASGRPTALIATSGTAVSEWLPAVTEADLARIPLILLSADRPPELRQCGANQTTRQTDLFGNSCRFSMELPLPEQGLYAAACRFAVQAAGSAHWPLPGPVHLNIPFREPLTPVDFPLPDNLQPAHLSRPVLDPNPEHLDRVAQAISSRPGIIVCGPETGTALPAHEIAVLANRLNAPILADPLSNLRDGSHDRSQVIALYDLALRNPSFAGEVRPQWVLRFGAMPVSKTLNQFLEGLDGIRHILVDAHGRWADPLHQTTDLLQADPAGVAQGLGSRVSPADEDYLQRWKNQQKRVREIIDEEAPEEKQLIDTLTLTLPENTLLLSGNSLPIRQLDWFHRGRERPLRITCNRGASGIDGNIATLLGMASACRQPVVGLLGDLTLIHDIGSLAAAKGLNATLLVLDNGGGGIFDHLPQAVLPEHDALFITPNEVDIPAIVQGFGVDYLPTTPGQLANHISEAANSHGVSLLHLQLTRSTSLAQHKRLWTRLNVE